MFLIRYGIIQSILINYGIDLKYPLVNFFALVLSVILVAAAGYMINDYHDVEIDLINKNEKVSIGKTISARAVLHAYLIINAVALVIAGYTSIMSGKTGLFFIFPVTIGALWFYSTTYKSQLLIGTFIVSLLTAIVPMLVLLFEIPKLYESYHTYSEAYTVLIKLLTGWCAVFATFAFTTTFIRELIKDAEDFEGDRVSGRNTMPIVFGLQATKWVVAILIFVVILSLEFLFFKYLKTTCTIAFDTITFFYFHLLIILPMIITLIVLLSAKEKKDYSIASAAIKVVIVTGVLYALVVRYNLMKCV